MSNRDLAILTIMSIIGLIASGVVIYELYVLHHPPPFCVLNTTLVSTPFNCMKVLTSSYANVFGVSLDFVASLWFIINITLVFMLLYFAKPMAKRVFYALFVWRFLGLAIVPYLIYLEFFVVHSICLYCTIMHGAIIIDFIIVSYFLFSKHSRIRAALFQSAPKISLHQ
ncbi:vitamin K epoxide reductase family protein [Candidatus Marsarchaeota archaeon]|nr:vitamin K epoxide reductase family protein [Candidatus Marsarchaeota archaeon]MCL5404816.1 vitamin K epoxide reductase family protein [Candidatus Marsarchaeota archaeon]